MNEDEFEAARIEAGTAFSVPLETKLKAVIATLLLSVVAAPVTYIRRDRIREIEGTESLVETLSLSVGLMIFFGVATTLVAGVCFLTFARQRSAGSLTKDELKQQFLVEDFFSFWLAFGILLVWTMVPLLVVAGLVPGMIDTLYDAGIAVYQPFGVIPVDIRLVSVVGGVSAVLIGVLWRFGT